MILLIIRLTHPHHFLFYFCFSLSYYFLESVCALASKHLAPPADGLLEEIEKQKGSQFDSLVADKMLEIIDADVDYQLREQPEEE